MKTSKTQLLSVFTALCEAHNLATSEKDAINKGLSEFAILDYDRFLGGYMPQMYRVGTGSRGSFLSLSTNDLRLSTSKMYDKLALLLNFSTYVQNIQRRGVN